MNRRQFRVKCYLLLKKTKKQKQKPRWILSKTRYYRTCFVCCILVLTDILSKTFDLELLKWNNFNLEHLKVISSVRCHVCIRSQVLRNLWSLPVMTCTKCLPTFINCFVYTGIFFLLWLPRLLVRHYATSLKLSLNLTIIFWAKKNSTQTRYITMFYPEIPSQLDPGSRDNLALDFDWP